MRHGRAKAARKTLQYFQRTIGLSKPYKILLDGNFIVLCCKHFEQSSTHSNNNKDNNNNNHNNPSIVDRISRVLQVHTTTTTTTNNDKDNHNHNGSSSFGRKEVEFCIAQETLDELQTVLESFNRKLQSQSSTKTATTDTVASKVVLFEQAIEWIHRHCHILPRVVADTNDNNNSNDKDSQKNLPPWMAMIQHVWGRQNDSTTEAISNPNERNNSTSTTTSTANYIPYIVASQDEEYLDILRRGNLDKVVSASTIATTATGSSTDTTNRQHSQNMTTSYVVTPVPIMRLANNNSVLLLEQPSKQFQHTSRNEERQKWTNRNKVLSEQERALVDLVVVNNKKSNKTTNGPCGVQGTVMDSSGTNTGFDGGKSKTNYDRYQQRKSRKKAKGPNPLSCKRKQQQSHHEDKKSSSSAAAAHESASKKRRDRAKRQKTTTTTAV